MFTLHVAVNTYWTYTTESLSNCHAARSCTDLLHPCKRASCHGLQVRSTWYHRNIYVYIRTSIVLFWEERPSDLCCECNHVDRHPSPESDPCGAFLETLWSPWCNWCVCRDCVLSLLNVHWNSSCWHYSSTYLMYVNNVFKQNFWLNVCFGGPWIWA